MTELNDASQIVSVDDNGTITYTVPQQTQTVSVDQLQADLDAATAAMAQAQATLDAQIADRDGKQALLDAAIAANPKVQAAQAASDVA